MRSVLRFTGKCLVHDCHKKACWFCVSKTRKTISAKYCGEHYHGWAVPVKIGRKEGWEKHEQKR